MKSHLKNTFGVTAVVVCWMVLTQVAAAQSGSRNSGNQLPQTLRPQRLPSAAVQETYRAPQGSAQRRQSFSYESRPREITRAGLEQYGHRAWDNLLQKYVDRNGNVDYATWQSNEQDRSTLLQYLRGMSSIDASVRPSRQSEMAFWINAYNALTIEGILQLFPTKSIKDHAPDANGFNIWDDFKLPVGGTEYSLNDIEHKILRKMGDPRIHFAIVCASKSCPQLSQRAYFADSLDEQLAYSTGLFFHSSGKFSYDLQRGQIGLSPIIKWFGEDFGRSDQERLQYLSQFMPADAGRLAASGSATISYLDYDWGLNLAPRKSSVPGRKVVSVQALRSQGSTTRQQSSNQNFSTQGSSTRQPIETYRSTQQQRRCDKDGCLSQSAYDQRAFGQ